ncbi:Ca2+-binding protein, RTX toxin-related, partial [Rhodoblastus acidophilus]
VQLNLDNLVEKFVFYDNTSDHPNYLTVADIEQMLQIAGGNIGDNEIHGVTDQPNVLDGGPGDDKLYGGAAADSYAFSAGYGFDLIQETQDKPGVVDKVVFGASVHPDALKFSPGANGSDLLIDLGDGSDVLTIANGLGDASVEQFTFADGSSLSIDQIKAKLLVGTANDDNLVGFDGRNDAFDGGAGSDAMSGGTGDDVYNFGFGDGEDSIFDTSGTDTVRFGTGVTADKVAFSVINNDLVATLSATDNLVIIGGAGNTPVETFVFDGGASLTLAQIRAQIAAQRTLTGQDVIDLTTYGQTDYAQASTGNDRIKVAPGETLVFSSGDGVDELQYVNRGQSDTVQFSDLAASAALVRPSGNDVVISFTETGDSIRIDGALNGERQTTIQFADGVRWTPAQLAQQAVLSQETSGADVIIGGNVAETIQGGLGDDFIQGGAGDDTYLFARGDGRDAILDTTGGVDTLNLSGYALADLRAAWLAPGENAIVLRFADSADSVTLAYESAFNGVDSIVFSDGALTRDQLLARLRGQGSDGDDRLTGTTASETFAGGKGNDTIVGGGGADVYLFSRGDGRDLITSSGAPDGQGVLKLGAGISRDDLILYRDASGAITIALAGTQDSVTVAAPTGSIDPLLSKIIFADNSSWSFADLAASIPQTSGDDTIMVPSGGSTGRASTEIFGGLGNDILQGGRGNDILEGGLGDDTLTGGPGADVYSFGPGDGQDVIVENGDDDANVIDRIHFGPGIAESDVRLVERGSDVVVLVGAGDQRITIRNMLANGAQGVEQIDFADGGVVWTRADVIARLATGGDGDDRIDMSAFGSRSNTIAGGKGNDTLIGGANSDTYLFNKGDGRDTIYEGNEYWSNADVLRLGGGLSINDLVVTRNGNDLTLHFRGVDDAVTIKDETAPNWWNAPINQVVFADGTLTADQLVASVVSSEQAAVLLDLLPSQSFNPENVTKTFDAVADFTNANPNGPWQYGEGVAGSSFTAFTNYSVGSNGVNVWVSNDGTPLIGENFSGQTQSGGSWVNPTGVLVVHPGSSRDAILRFAAKDSGTYHFTTSFALEDLSPTGIVGEVFKNNTQLYSGVLTGAGATVSKPGASESFSGDVHLFAGETLDFVVNNYGWYGYDTTALTARIDFTPDIDPNALTGTAGADVITGGAGDDVISGMGGDDTLRGGLGNDTYIYNAGDGEDTIEEAGGVDKLAFGPGISATDIAVHEINGTDIALRVKGGGVLIKNALIKTESRLETIAFADGAQWSWSDVVTRAMRGGSGDDAISMLSARQQTQSENLVLNGSFELFDTSRGSKQSWGWSQPNGTVPGWTDANGANFEVQPSGMDGQSSSDATYWLDMVSSRPMDISQTIAGLTDGDKLVLSFDHANRTGASYGGNCDVYWNGQLVGSVSAPSTSYVTDQFVVTAQQGDNVLEFKETGTVGWGGATLDNVRLVRIAGGTADSASMTADGGAGDDTITGSSAADILIGGTGDDLLQGGGGDDIYQFRLGDGQDVIVDSQGANRLVFDASITAEMVSLVSGKPNIILQIAGTGDRIDLGAPTAAQTLSIAEVDFASGEVWTAAQLIARARAATPGNDAIFGDAGANALSGGAGDDVIVALAGDDTLAGGLGADMLEGGDGDDRYDFARGDGQDVISDAGGADTIWFDASIAQGDVSVSQSSDGANLVISVVGTSDRITIQNAQGDGRVETIHFASDGANWTENDILARLGSSGDDVIYGDDGSNTLAGGAGNDTLIGGGGADEYCFTKGDGQDRIIDASEWNSGDVLKIYGYASTDAIFSRAAPGSSDLVIRFTGSTDSILIQNEFNTSLFGVESVYFDTDKVSFDPAALRSRVLACDAAGGAQTLTGLPGNSVAETFVVAPTVREIVGSGCNDRYEYHKGDGNLRIDLSAGSDLLKLIDYDAGDVASVLRAGPDSFDVIITFKDSTDRVTLANALHNDNGGWFNAHIEFKDHKDADGKIVATAWSRDDLRRMELACVDTAGNDNVLGFDGDDTLTAAAGDDYMAGGAGNDTYAFTRGNGADTVDDADGNSWSDKIVFGNINSTDVSVSRLFKGSTSVVFTFVGDASDSVTVYNALSNDGRGVETYVFADIDPATGKPVTWTKAQVQARLANGAPTAVDDDGFSATSGVAATLLANKLLVNDYDPNNDKLKIVSVDAGASGAASLNAAGDVVFTANSGFTGVATLIYTISDGQGGFAEANVSVRVRPVATAVDDNGFSVAEDGSISIKAARLLANDPDGDRMVIASVLDAQHGAVTLSSDGSITFTPELYYRGPAQFSYVANTPEGGRAQATVYLTVTPVNHAPQAQNDGAYVTLENQAFSIDAHELLVNDGDVDHDVLTLTSVTSSADIQVAIADDGSIIVTPVDYFYGSSYFDYTVADPSGATSTARVTVNVTARNLPPVARDDAFTAYQDKPILENEAVIISASELLANDSDHENDPIRLISVGGAYGGSARLLDNNTVQFTPWTYFNGAASFNNTISDGIGGQATATATLTYQWVNQPPVAADDSYNSNDPELQRVLVGTEGQPLEIAISELLKNDYDIEDDDVVFKSVGGADHGKLTITDHGTIIYTPDAGYYSYAQFAYEVQDPQGLPAAARVFLYFNPSSEDAPPIANTDQLVSQEDVPLTIKISTLLTNDASADRAPLTFLGWSPPNGFSERLHGTLKTDANGDLLFTPDANWNGLSVFYYTIGDDRGHTATGKVTIDTSATADDPTVVDDEGFVTPLDVPMVIRVSDILKNDYSVDYFNLQSGEPIVPNDLLTFVSVDSIDHGAAEVMTVGGQQYIVVREADGFTGKVTLKYRIKDSNGLEGAGYVVGTVLDSYSGELNGTIVNDLLIGNGRDELIKTLTGDDYVEAGDGDNVIFGGAGVDTILSGSGADIIHSGVDRGSYAANTSKAGVISSGGGDDLVFDGAGADSIDGGAGFDIVDYSASHTFVVASLEARLGRSGDAQGDVYLNIEGLTGSKFNDTLTGDAKSNLLDGGDGDDLLSGGAGDDTLRGGAGDDTLIGGAGADVLDGGAGVNTVDYSASSTAVRIDLSQQTATGGDAAGDTLINIRNVIGTLYNDRIVASDAGGLLSGGRGDDTLIGGAGDDTLIGGRGADLLQGGGGVNTVDYSGSDAAVVVDMMDAAAEGGEAAGDVFSNIQVVIGTVFADTLRGDDADNVFVGGPGADVIDGRGGFDAVDYSDATGAVQIDLAAGTGKGGEAEGDTLTNIEKVIGSHYNDQLSGGDGAQTFDGGWGDDALAGGDGSDSYLFGFGDGQDTIVEAGEDSDIDRLVLKPEVTIKDVSILRQGDDLLVELENKSGYINDIVTVKAHFAGASNGVEQIVFADGTVWDRATIAALAREGQFNATDDTFHYGVENETSVIDPASLLVNDVSGSTDGLKLVSVQDAAGGVVALDGNGKIVFTPDHNFRGDAYFFYTAADQFGRESTARVRVQVNPVDQPPVAADHSGLYGYENTILKIPVSYLLNGATDPENDTLAVVGGEPLVDGNGEAVMRYSETGYTSGTNVAFKIEDGYVYIKPAPDYFGYAGFQYIVADPSGKKGEAKVELYIKPVNQAPRSGRDEYTVRLEKTTTISLASLMANDYDVEGDAITFTGVSDPTNGSIAYDAEAKSVSFTPTELGEATFSYGLKDALGATSTITVRLNVVPLNDAPVAHDDSGFMTDENQTLVIDVARLLANDSDPNKDALTLTSVSRFAIDGEVTLRDDKIFFVPRADYNGEAGFDYTIDDGHGGVATAHVSIDILPIDKGATLRDDIVHDVQDTRLTILAAEAFGNDSDPEGDVQFFKTATVLGALDVKYLSKNATFSALTTRGEALPSWLSFDAQSLTFRGVVPTDVTTPITIEVRVFDPYDADRPNAFVRYFTFGSGDAKALADGFNVRDAVLKGYAIRGDFSQIDAFGPGDFDAATSVRATLADGSELPSWLSFDASALRLQGVAPEGSPSFDVVLTYSHAGTTPAETTSYAQTFAVDPAKLAGGVTLNTGIVALALGGGKFTARLSGNQPLPSWIAFDPDRVSLSLSGVAPASDAQTAHVQVTFTPKAKVLQPDVYAAATGAFTLEFLIDPNAPFDPAINAVLSNAAFFASEGLFGLDLNKAASVTPMAANDKPLPSWLHFNAATLTFFGSPPPEFVGALPVRLGVVGKDSLPSFSILTEVVVDPTYKVIDAGAFSATASPKEIELTAPSHYNGEVAVTYTSVDDKGFASVNSAIDVVNIAPRAVPVRPVNDTFTLLQGRSVTFTLDELLANDRDDNGDFFHAISIARPEHGSLVMITDSIDLAPPQALAGLNGGTFSATLVDGSALPDWMVLDAATGHISARPPFAISGNYTFAFGWTDGTAQKQGKATYALDGNDAVRFIYRPDADFYGVDTFAYAVSDDKQTPVTATVALQVTQALQANDDTFSTPSDTELVIDPATLFSNDVSGEKLSLTLVGVGDAVNGAVSFDGSKIVFTSAHYLDGEASFAYQVTDGDGHISTAHAKLNVTSIDHAPIAEDVKYLSTEDAPLTISVADLLSKASDVDGETLQLVRVVADDAANARVLTLPGDLIQFVPKQYFNGDAGFTYFVSDGYKSASGHIVVNYAPVNDAPIANVDGVFTGDENSTLRISLATLAANDVDIEGDSFSVVSVINGVNGSVAIDGNDAVFTPRAGYYGNAGFEYVVEDSKGAQSLGQVNLQIKPAHTPPIAVSDSGYTMLQDTTLDLDPKALLANDIDPDGKGLVFLGFTDYPVTKLDSGLYRVTPPFNYSGKLNLTYAITNGSGLVATTVVSIDVQHVEHAPVGVDDAFAMVEDQPLTVSVKDLLANDFDLDSQALSFDGVADAYHVTATDDGAGHLVVTPDLNTDGKAWFDYRIVDSTGRTATARVNLDIAHVNHAPTIGEAPLLQTDEEQSFSITLANSVFADVDEDALLVDVQGLNGAALPEWLRFDRQTLTLSGTPPKGYYGEVTLELIADDGQARAVKATTFTVNRIFTAPTASDGVLIAPHGQSVDISELVRSLFTPGQNGDAATIVGLTSANGVVSLVDGHARYTAPQSGEDTLTFTVEDSHLQTARGTISVTVDPGPSVANGVLTVGHDQSRDISTLLESLVAPGLPGDKLSLVGASASNGMVAIVDGKASYISRTGGTDTISFTYADEHGDIATGVVNVAIDPGPTLASANVTKIGHGQATTIAAAAPGLAGDTLTLVVATAPALGTLSLIDGAVTYTAPANVPASGATVSFAYRIQDEYGDLSPLVTSSLQLDPGPTAANANISVGHNQTLNETALVKSLITAGLSGDVETITDVSGAHVSLVDGVVSYASPASGTDWFTYTVADQLGEMAAGMLQIKIDPGPTAAAVNASVNLGQSLDLTSAILAAAKPGLPGDTLTIISENATGARGSVMLANGALTYSASGAGLSSMQAGATLSDSFSFTIADQYGDTSTAVVTITVSNPVTIISGPQYGGGTIQGTGGVETINAYGYGNIIYANGGSGAINAGLGNAMVYAGSGNLTINLAGYYDTVKGGDGDDIVIGSAGNATVTLGNGANTIKTGGYYNVVVLGDGADVVNLGLGNGRLTLGNGDDKITIAGYGNIVVAGNGSDVLQGGDGNSTLTFGQGNNAISTQGYGNIIKVGDGANTIVAGSGNETVNAGNGDNTITLSGYNNVVTVGSGRNIVKGGAGGDKVTVGGGTATLTFNGWSDHAILNSGVGATIYDNGYGLEVDIGSSAGATTIYGFDHDYYGVIDLLNNAGGFTSASAAVAALTSDGHGGSLLSLGTNGSIDLVNVAPKQLTTANFKIG